MGKNNEVEGLEKLTKKKLIYLVNHLQNKVDLNEFLVADLTSNLKRNYNIVDNEIFQQLDWIDYFEEMCDDEEMLMCGKWLYVGDGLYVNHYGEILDDGDLI